MKIGSYFLAATLAVAALTVAGCNNNSSNTPSTTNSVTGSMATNGVINNTPPAGGITNTSTNLPPNK